MNKATASALHAASTAAMEEVLTYAQRFEQRQDYRPLEELASRVQRVVLAAGLGAVQESAAVMDMTDRSSQVARLADEAAELIERMRRDHDRLFEILACELSDAELRELSDEWYVDTGAIVHEDGDDMSTYTTLVEWVVSELNGDGGETWLVPPRRPLRIEDVLEA